MKESLDFLEKLNIDKNVVLACSGGPDSMCLLQMLKNNGYNVICAHVNHNLRTVSEEEYKFVKNYCKNNNIIFEGMKIQNYKNNKFTENEARKKRYDFFIDVLKKYNYKVLITAHHGDDLIETILMRIIRGSNLNGYKGFSKSSRFKDYLLVRPLIFYTKKDIEKYVKDNNIPYVTDDTNFSKKYTRNRIRLDVLPILKNEYIDVHKKFLDFNEELEKTQDYINYQLEDILNDIYKDNKLDLKKFKKQHDFIKYKLIETILYKYYNEDIKLITKKHINLIFDLINNTNKKINLPKNLIVFKEYDTLLFKKDKESKKYEYVFNDYLEIDNFGKLEKIEDTNEKSNYVIKLNSKDLKLPLKLRTIKDGDKISVKNLNGTKKVSRIFIDEKIPLSIRNDIPVLIDSNDTILWIPGIKKSKFDCYNNRIYDIIIKYTKKEKSNEKEK